MKIRRLISSSGKWYPGKNPATTVTVHETDNYKVGADADAHARAQLKNEEELPRQASWHWTVDDHEAVQSHPYDRRCWHAGDGDDPEGGNFTSVAVEICVNEDGDYDLALRNAAILIATEILPDPDVTAETVEDVVQHNHWSGKNCPRWLRSGRSMDWQDFLNSITKLSGVKAPEEEVVNVGMVSPAKGRVTSEYGPRNYAPSPFHAGIDIANDIGTPVYAAFAGTVKDEGSNVAPYRSGDRNVLIANPDGEGQYYGHLNKNFVKVGQRVKAGELIGEIGARGNVTGPHLHFEIWSNWRDPSSHRNPRIDFNYFDIKPGSTPRGTTESKPAPKPKPKPDTKPSKPSSSKNSKADNEAIQRALRAMGYYDGLIDGVDGSMQKASVRAYQRGQKYWPGKIVDSYWGPKTQAHYDWTKELQHNLNLWKGYKIRVDGDCGSVTMDRVLDVMKNNDHRGGAYYKAGGRISDGIPGPVFCKMLGIPAHP